MAGLLFLGNICLLIFGGERAGDQLEMKGSAIEKKPQISREQDLPFWKEWWRNQISSDQDNESQFSKFDGQAIDVNFEESVVSVMIDNISSAQALHSGVREASIVYEALAEGGITRLMLIFPYQEIEKVGPVRSARDYFVAIAEEYGGIFAHAGGSPAALEKLWGSKRLADADEDERIEGETYSFRDKDHLAPHNLFFNLLALREHIGSTVTLQPALKKWCFTDKIASTAKDIKTIDLDFSNDQLSPYFVRFRYDEKTQDYKRFYGKYQPTAHVDQYDSLQVAPKNVIVQIVPMSLISGDEKERMEMDYLGKGPAYFYTGGKKFSGSWEKHSQGSVTRFLDAEKNPVCLAPGQSWVAILSEETLLSDN